MGNTGHNHAMGSHSGHVRRFSEGLLDNDLILKELDLAPGQVVMDVGCGTGYMAKLFAKAVGPEGLVYAVDINESYIGTLRDETEGTNIKALVCDIAERTPVENATVDRVYMSTVMHAQPARKIGGIIREFQRILKPDGILAFVEMEKRETAFGPPVQQRYSPEELQAALPFAAKKTVSVAEHFYLQLFYARARDT